MIRLPLKGFFFSVYLPIGAILSPLTLPGHAVLCGSTHTCACAGVSLTAYFAPPAHRPQERALTVWRG
jgi:hypothetical protein